MKRFKVFKKLCSLALILSMLVSMIPINVFATTQSTIDVSRKGTLTITKYDSNYAEDNKETEEDETVKIPIPGVEFTIYEIFSITDKNGDGILDYSFTPNFESFFRNLEIGEKVGLSVDEVRDMDGSELEALTEDLQTYITDNSIEGTKNDTTNIDGEVKFGDLSLGFYFVVETNYPDDVITAHQPFFVSVPQSVNTLDQENKVISSQWIYDIVAQPKNTTAYTAENSLTLIKVGLEDVKLQNAGFVLEKLNEDSEEEQWELVKLPRQLLTDANGEIKVGGLTQGKYRFVEIIAPDGYILNTNERYEFEVVWNPETDQLEYVYEGSQDISLNIKVANEKPTIEKVADKLTAGLGETVRWEITTTVPSLINELKTFTITDTLSSGLEFKTPINLKVVQGEDEEGNDNTLENALKVDSLDIIDSFTFTEENEDLFYVWTVVDKKLVIKFNPKKLTPSVDIVVSYDTVINEAAVIFPSGNVNDAKLDYSVSTDSSSTDKGTVEDSDVVYSFGLQVNKTATDKTTPLPGAKFTLCKKETTECHEEVSGTNGIIKFPQLAAGEYVLTEVQAPNGYNLLKEPIAIKITAHEEADGLIADVIAIVNGKEMALEPNNSSSYYYELNVVNNKGFTLPETGGMGTVIFTVVGLGMMGLAGAAYIALKRKESQQ